MEKFKSSYSKPMLLATLFLLIVLLFAMGVIMGQLNKVPAGSLSFVGLIAVVCFGLGSMVYAFMSQITYLCLTEDSLIIKKKFGQIIIPRKDILEVEYKKSINQDIRAWGISGLFGHIGWFWNKATGRYFALVKDGDSMLEIKTTGKCYVVSCDDYKKVLKLLENS